MALMVGLSLLPSKGLGVDFAKADAQSNSEDAFAEFLLAVQHSDASKKDATDRIASIAVIDSHALIDGDLLEERFKAASRPSLWKRVVEDHRNYYDVQTFQLLAGGLLVGAAIANTKLDQEIQDHFQTSIRGATSDDWAEFLHANKELGDGWYTLPVFATAWSIGSRYEQSRFGRVTARWGERSIRSFLVGCPPLILAQRLTGGSRPAEKDRGSRWLPLQDNNGVSGHSFMASLPFLNAAKMTQNRWLKTAFFAGSLLGPLSRVNDNAHYPSQVALGWWMSYLAASAVDQAENARSDMQLYPLLTEDGYGAMVEFRL